MPSGAGKPGLLKDAGVAPASGEGVKFLGVKIHSKYTAVQDSKVRGFKCKVKKITRRNSKSPLAHHALPNKYFDELCLFDLAPVQTGTSVSWK